jgi:ABC-type branched-subunit amino acid transport system ATPase component
LFEDVSLLDTPPHGVIRRGIARTFQNLELFKTMTVRENMERDQAVIEAYLGTEEAA